MDKELLAGDFMIDRDILESIVAYCIKLQLLYLEGEHLYSEKLIDRLQPLLTKRKRKRNWSDHSKGKGKDEAASRQTSIFDFDAVNNPINALETSQEARVMADVVCFDKEFYEGVYIGFESIANDNFNQTKGFWDLYDKKIDKKASRGYWQHISSKSRADIMKVIPKYKVNYPDSQYRKNPFFFLKNECWQDEGVFETKGAHITANLEVLKVLKGKF
ncbi:MAG: hypothetical protein JKY54_13045 [Flavobacteriales bacterium]|nr:hypothetical protein [Flavobacteriales bacterium]